MAAKEEKMEELIINTNEVVINEGTLKKDISEKVEVKDSKNILLLEEINRKFDLLLGEKESHNLREVYLTDITYDGLKSVQNVIFLLDEFLKVDIFICKF